jgi:hypothetical protein
VQDGYYISADSLSIILTQIQDDLVSEQQMQAVFTCPEILVSVVSSVIRGVRTNQRQHNVQKGVVYGIEQQRARIDHIKLLLQHLFPGNNEEWIVTLDNTKSNLVELGTVKCKRRALAVGKSKEEQEQEQTLLESAEYKTIEKYTSNNSELKSVHVKFPRDMSRDISAKHLNLVIITDVIVDEITLQPDGTKSIMRKDTHDLEIYAIRKNMGGTNSSSSGHRSLMCLPSTHIDVHAKKLMRLGINNENRGLTVVLGAMIHFLSWFSGYDVVVHSSAKLPDVLYNITGAKVLPLRAPALEVQDALHPEAVTEPSLVKTTFM